MSDYISREEPIDKIIDEVEKEFEKVNIPLVDKLTIFAKVQNALYKCADVRENIHGEWIYLDECSNSGYYCSNCHKKVVKEGWSETVKKIKFCPNCGADMRGE